MQWHVPVYVVTGASGDWADMTISDKALWNEDGLCCLLCRCRDWTYDFIVVLLQNEVQWYTRKLCYMGNHYQFR